MKKIIRNIIIFVVVIIIGMVGYSFFFKKPAAPASSLTTTAGAPSPADTTATAGANAAEAADADAASKEFLALLLNIQSIKLDDSFFASPGFLALQDFSHAIPPDTNPGRPNPFAPLGANTALVSTQVSTSAPSLQTGTTATLNGALTVGDSTTMRWFEYGTTPALGIATTPKAQAKPGAFSEAVTGLTPNTTYYVKAVASIGGVSVAGNQVTWKTALK